MPSVSSAGPRTSGGLREIPLNYRVSRKVPAWHAHDGEVLHVTGTSNVTSVLTFRSDPHLAQHNILRGLEVVLEQQQRIAQELPFVEIDRLREKVVQAHMSSLRGAAAKDCADESGKRFRISVATMTRRRWRRPSGSVEQTVRDEFRRELEFIAGFRRIRQEVDAIVAPPDKPPRFGTVVEHSLVRNPPRALPTMA